MQALTCFAHVTRGGQFRTRGVHQRVAQALGLTTETYRLGQLRYEAEAAHAAVRTKDTDVNAQFRRLAAKRGAKNASVAVAHSILFIVWHLLQHDCLYVDLAANYFDEHDRQPVARRLVKRLTGFVQTLQTLNS
ncbi:MAG: hypothetical protein JOZ87_39200 [Chloroflexi bacterium]|nr:hypothetical protein [Chloroflexota bacterium]